MKCRKIKKLMILYKTLKYSNRAVITTATVSTTFKSNVMLTKLLAF